MFKGNYVKSLELKSNYHGHHSVLSGNARVSSPINVSPTRNAAGNVVQSIDLEPQTKIVVLSRTDVQDSDQMVDPSNGLEPIKISRQFGAGNQLYRNTNKSSPQIASEPRLKFNTGQIIPPLKKRKIEIIREQFFLHKEIQTDLTGDDINALFLYFKNAVEERKELLFKISTLVIDVDFFKGNDKKTRFYTGLTTWSLLNNFYELVKEYIPNHFNSKLSQFQILAMTLMKLRLNFNFTDLGYRFQVDRTTISNNFHRCIYILFKLFHKSKIIRWPKSRKDITLNTPSYFRSTFKERIIIIIDCFEIVIEKAGNLRASAQSYSKYKHRTTIKYLIGITTTGVIIFISDAFGGRASDKFITLKSELLDYLQDGDVVLADKGFLIETEVEATGASLKMPSFVRNGNQLHPTEVETSRHISSIRIHVERVISTLRQKFNICSDIAPMAAVSKHNDLFHNDLYNIIVFICCSLINLCPSVVNNNFEI